MKGCLVSVFLSFVMGGCGSLFGTSGVTNTCANSSLLGTWSNGGETIAFTSSCGFTSTICHSSATASNASGGSGTVTLTGWVGDASCGALQNRTCTYTVGASSLVLTCQPTGGGNYTKN